MIDQHTASDAFVRHMQNEQVRIEDFPVSEIFVKGILPKFHFSTFRKLVGDARPIGWVELFLMFKTNNYSIFQHFAGHFWGQGITYIQKP